MGRKITWVLAALATVGVVSVGAPVAAYLQPSLLGADEALIVLTGSMEPNISPGDVVFIAPVSIDDVREGDIINFEPHPGAGKTYTHRVIEITEDQRGTVLTTKGDANEDPDPMQVNDAMLQGRVEHTIPHLGKLIAFMTGKLLHLGLVVGSIVMVGLEVSSLLEQLDESRGSTRFRVVDHARRFKVVRQR